MSPKATAVTLASNGAKLHKIDIPHFDDNNSEIGLINCVGIIHI